MVCNNCERKIYPNNDGDYEDADDGLFCRDGQKHRPPVGQIIQRFCDRWIQFDFNGMTADDIDDLRRDISRLPSQQPLWESYMTPDERKGT